MAKRKLIRNHRVPKIVPNELKKLKNNLDALDLQAMVKKEEETYQIYKKAKNKKTRMRRNIINNGVRSQKRGEDGSHTRDEILAKYFAGVGKRLSHAIPGSQNDVDMMWKFAQK